MREIAQLARNPDANYTQWSYPDSMELTSFNVRNRQDSAASNRRRTQQSQVLLHSTWSARNGFLACEIHDLRESRSGRRMISKLAAKRPDNPKGFPRAAVLLVLLSGSVSGTHASDPLPADNALVMQALEAELRAAQDTDHPMEYRLRKCTPRLTSTKEIIETRDVAVARLLMITAHV